MTEYEPAPGITYTAPAATYTAVPCPVHENVAPAPGVTHTGPVPVTECVTGPAVTFRAPVVEQIVSRVPQITKEIVEATQRVPSAKWCRGTGTWCHQHSARGRTRGDSTWCYPTCLMRDTISSNRKRYFSTGCQQRSTVPSARTVLPAPAGTYEVPLWYHQKRYAFVTRLERELSPAIPFALSVEMARDARPRNSSVYREIR